MSSPATRPTAMEADHGVGEVVARARAAQSQFANASQEQTDDAVRALAWSLYEPSRARAVAEMAVADTGLGNVPDKIIKKQRKTFGTLRDLLRVKTVGIIEEDAARGIVKYAKPMGVVAAVTPSTNPGATPVNKAMMAIKGRNAIIIAPSPLGYKTTETVVNFMRAELDRIGAPADLVQILPHPVTKESTTALMRAVELVVVTGSQDNVRRAYSSGTPAIGVGAGNVPVIIEKTANLDDAAEKICASKIFDNSTSCSSENSVVIEDAIYDQAIAALERAGGYMCSSDQKEHIEKALWVGGKLNRNLIARGPEVLAPAFGLPEAAKSAKFFMVEESKIGKSAPFSGEKLCLVLTVYRARDFADAKQRVRDDLGSPRAWPFVRHSYQESGTRPRACGGSRRCPRPRQLRAHLRQRRRLRLRTQFYAQHGLRLLAKEQHLGKPELQALPQHHASRHPDHTGQARRGGTVRAVVGKDWP